MGEKIQPYGENGVSISKSSLTVGDNITLSYGGLLAKCGATHVIAHIGYGESWNEKGDIPMVKDVGVFTTTFKVLLPGSLNISFKDIADNWDNNSTMNYSFEVKDKKKAAAGTEAKAVKTKAVKATVTDKTETKAKSVSKKTPTAKAKTAEKPEGAVKVRTAAKKKTGG